MNPTFHLSVALRALILSCLFSSVSASAQEVRTPFGPLSATPVAAAENRYTIEVGGRTLATVDAEELSFYRLSGPSQSPAQILITQWLPDAQCRMAFSVLTITAATKTSLSPVFGRCQQLQDVTGGADGVNVRLRAGAAAEQWTWANGQLSKRMPAPDAAGADAFLLYVNERHGYTLAYPASFFAHPVADSGDGRVFTPAAGDAELRVYAGLCSKGSSATPDAYVASHERDAKAHKGAVTYVKRGKNLAVVSGTVGTRIFYDKLLIQDGWCTQFRFGYEAAQHARYDALVGRIAASFKL